MSRDLFWAFQPNRVMEPSLPLRLGTPAIPSCRLAELARLARMVFSGMFSIKPAPKTGVGMRKLRLPLAASAAKSGCAKVQLGASELPAIVNRSWTPPSDLKRASRTGPSAVTKNGIVLLTLISWPTVNCGFCPTLGKAFALGEVPPAAGCEWQEPQELLLNAGPSPPLPGEGRATPSSSLNCDNPFWKNKICCDERPWTGLPGLLGKVGLPVTPKPLRGPGSRLSRLPP